MNALAYLEELEYLTSLLNVLFIQGKKWKNNANNIEFYNSIVTVMLDKTLKLYVPNIKISNHYKYLSNDEKMMNEIYPGESSFNLDGNLGGNVDKNVDIGPGHVTSFYSPMKKRITPAPYTGIGNTTNKENLSHNISNIGVMSPRRDFTRSNINSKAISLFYYRVDNCLNKILFNVTNVIKLAVAFDSITNKNSYPNYIKETYSRGGAMNYESNQNIRVLDEQCQNLLYALYFGYHSLDSKIKHMEDIEKLYEISIVFFGNINASINFGNLNLVYIEGKYY